jgi:hypothetical protein
VRDSRLDFERIASRRSPLATRKLIVDASSAVYAAYDRYNGFFGEGGIAVDKSIVPKADALAQALRGNFRALDTGGRYESMREDILSAVDIDNQLCPYCLVHFVGGAIDHVVPKDSHAEFSVLHLNLAPICDECNRLKGKRGPETDHTFLHPYYLQLPEEPFVFARVTLEQHIPKFRYTLREPPAMAADWFKAAADQFEVLQLAKRWGNAAAIEYSDQAENLSQLRAAKGSDGVRRELIGLAKSSERVFGRSYWKSVGWSALAASDEFCDGGFIK